MFPVPIRTIFIVRMMSLSCAFVLALVALTPPAGAQTPDFINFESPQVHPIRFSTDGSRLYVVKTNENRLAVYDTEFAAAPVLMKEIRVGLDPCSVTPRTADEVWVCNLLSDTVNVVDVNQGRVVATISVVDEPSDVVFAGGRAFVSAATRDEIHVFDVTTHALVGTVSVFGKDPRALAVSADGTKVYAAIQRSGNGTTIVPFDHAPAPPLPTNPNLPLAPQAGLIADADTPGIPWSLPDNDIVEIDAATLAVTRNVSGVGTTLYDLVVHPGTGEIFVANTEALNLIRFEPNLRGHFVDSRVTRVVPGTPSTVTPIDLNFGIDYAILPNPAANAIALSEPTGLALDAAANRLYVAAQGTDRIGVMDITTNTVIDRVELNPSGLTADKRGPRGLALHPSGNWLHVLNRLSDTVIVVNTQSATVHREFAIGTYDPVPASIRLGRKFAYDATLSGNGTVSCASCHIDGDTDGLAWDLGDPGGSLAAPPSQPFPFNVGLTAFHPMKGPMTTQTLKGLADVGTLHWRGDRATFQSFNPTFDTLLGGVQLSTAEMDVFADWGTTVAFPPNPNQNLDRSLKTTPANANQATGAVAYDEIVGGGQLGILSCAGCHSLPNGTNGFTISAQIINEPQQMKVPQLRNMYRKNGFRTTPGPKKSGFGFTHDGGFGTVLDFLTAPVFNPWPLATRDDLVEFVLGFDTGAAPLVGFQALADTQTANSPALATTLTMMEARASAGDIDLVALGDRDGEPVGFLLDTTTGLYEDDDAFTPAITRATMLANVAAGDAHLVFMGVPPGSGIRIALDRDRDGDLDGSEGVVHYGTGVGGPAVATPRMETSSEPAIGNAQFSLVMEDGPANATGFLLAATAPTATPVFNFTLLADVLSAPLTILEVVSDDRGAHVVPAGLPNDPSFVDISLYFQAIWFDTTIGQWTASRGLEVTFRE